MGKVSVLYTAGGGQTFDLATLLVSVSISGRNGSAYRSAKVALSDDDGPGHERLKTDVMRGDQCLIAYTDDDGKRMELFRGMVMKTERSSSKTLVFTACDIGIYLSNNKDTFCYTGKTASDIFRDVCTRFGVPMGDVAETGYAMPEMSNAKTTGWDAICDALEQTYKNTGKRFMPIAIEGKMHLLDRILNIEQYLLETTRNVSAYSQMVSIEKIKTRLKIFDKEDTCVAEAYDAATEAKIGRFQDIDKADDEMNTAQITALAKSKLLELDKPEETLTVECLGIPGLITGKGVYLRINPLELEASYYIDEDTHTFEGARHMMKLGLVLTAPTSVPTITTSGSAAGGDAAAEGSGDLSALAAGTIVTFAGGPHYTSSTATSPAGGNKAGGPAKITRVAKEAAHPYHLIGGKHDSSVDGDSDVYGWVDASTVS